MTAVEPPTVLSDDALIRDILAGHPEAYGNLVRRYERQVHAVIWAILRDHHAAQDAAQDTFLKAYAQLPSLRSPKSFGSWVLAIARRTAADRLRTATRLTFTAALPDAPTLDPAPPAFPAQQDDAILLLKNLAQLPDA